MYFSIGVHNTILFLFPYESVLFNNRRNEKRPTIAQIGINSGDLIELNSDVDQLADIRLIGVNYAPIQSANFDDLADTGSSTSDAENPSHNEHLTEWQLGVIDDKLNAPGTERCIFSFLIDASG